MAGHTPHFLGQQSGVTVRTLKMNAAYLFNRMRALCSDRKAIFMNAEDAQSTSDYLIARSKAGQGRGAQKWIEKAISAKWTRDRRPIDKVCQNRYAIPMATMNVSLPDPMKSWAEARTKDGRYSNVSDYVRDLIRKDQERMGAITELQALVSEGVNSGPPRAFDLSEFVAQKTSAKL